MKEKITVTFEGEPLKIIKRIQKNSGVKDKGAVIVDAIALYNIVDKLSPKDGNLIIVKYDKKMFITNKKNIITIPRKKK